MKTTPVVMPNAPPMRKVVAASGRKNVVICSGRCRRVRAASIMAGSAASDERALKATACIVLTDGQVFYGRGFGAPTGKKRKKAEQKIIAAGADH